LVHGSEIIVDYYEPKTAFNQGSFTISNVIHGYRSLDKIQKDLSKALNSSDDCNIDIHCPLGVGWENQVRSVAMIVVGGSGICTGALINNSCDDGIPYFLTANHCLGGSTANWAFRFNWASPPGTESCATTALSVDPGMPYDQSLNGATVLASGTQADFALLKIDNMTVTDAINWNLFYAGWNNDDTDGLITQATGIHHPSGDVMKICREDNAPYHNTAAGAQVWYINQWEQGVTEPGSSGSPLFDQNGRIIGQLYGGLAACSGTSNNGQYDYYGRLGVSWSLGVGDYLDPVSCGGTNITNDGWDPNGPALSDNSSIQSVNKPKGDICGSEITPSVKLRNAGGNNLTSCIINYNIDGGTNATFNWSGNLNPNSSIDVDLPTLTVSDGAHVFNAFTTLPNGVSDSDPSNDASLSNFAINSTGIETNVNIETDCWGYETYWEIKDVSTALVASGGNTIGIAPGGLDIGNNGDPGAYGDETSVSVKLCLAEGCYDFTIYDDYGDGLEGSASAGCSTDGTYSITNSSNTVLTSMTAVAFGNSETNNFCVVNNAGLAEAQTISLNVYPNPTDGLLTIELIGNINHTNLFITDVYGRAIFTRSITEQNSTVDLTNLSSGSYFVTVSDESSSIMKRIIIK